MSVDSLPKYEQASFVYYSLRQLEYWWANYYLCPKREAEKDHLALLHQERKAIIVRSSVFTKKNNQDNSSICRNEQNTSFKKQATCFFYKKKRNLKTDCYKFKVTMDNKNKPKGLNKKQRPSQDLNRKWRKNKSRMNWPNEIYMRHWVLFVVSRYYFCSIYHTQFDFFQDLINLDTFVYLTMVLPDGLNRLNVNEYVSFHVEFS